MKVDYDQRVQRAKVHYEKEANDALRMAQLKLVQEYDGMTKQLRENDIILRSELATGERKIAKERESHHEESILLKHQTDKFLHVEALAQSEASLPCARVNNNLDFDKHSN